MTRRLIVLVATAMLVAALADRLCYRAHATLDLSLDHDLPDSVAQGLYDVERAPDGLTFAWTGPSFSLTLPRLDRRVPWTVTIRMRGARADRTTPDIRVAIDGVSGPPAPVGLDFEDYTYDIPATGTSADLHLDAVVEPTIVAGSGDTRVLGVQIDSLRIAPRGAVRPPARFTPTAIAAGVLAAALAFTDVPIAALLLAIGLFAGTAAWITTRGMGAFFPLPIAWLLLAAGTAGAGAAALGAGRGRRRQAEAVAAITAIAAMLKLLVLFHPDVPIGDTLFQAHRFQDVLAGQYVFTSTAPGNYQFPYAIGLYVASLPFAALTHSAFDRVALLRLVVVVADAALAGCLYRFVAAWRHDTAVAIGSVAAYHLVPLGFGVIITGNLTNAFSQALTLPVLPLVGAGAVVAASGVALLGFLSHTGTLAILATELAVTAAWLVLRSDSGLRRIGWRLFVGTGVAVIAAFVLYYVRFMDVYVDALRRISAETGHAAAGGRTPLMRLEDVPRTLLICYGWPVLVSMVIGAMVIARERTDRSAARVVFLAWATVCATFVVIGIVTPVDFRHYLAAVPLVAVLVAVGVGDLWRRGSTSRTAALVLGTWVLWAGISAWMVPLAG